MLILKVFYISMNDASGKCQETYLPINSLCVFRNDSVIVKNVVNDRKQFYATAPDGFEGENGMVLLSRARRL